MTLAGRGELEPWVREMSKSNPAIKFEGWLPMESLQPLIDEADLIPSLYEPRSKNAQLATPGKLLSALSLGIPVLVPSGSYQAELVERFNCGIVVTWGDVGQVRDSFARLSTDRKLYDELSVNARKAFEHQFSWEAMTARLVSAYDGLLGRAQGRPNK